MFWGIDLNFYFNGPSWYSEFFCIYLYRKYGQRKQNTAGVLHDCTVGAAIINHPFSTKYKTHRLLAALRRICGRNSL